MSFTLRALFTVLLLFPLGPLNKTISTIYTRSILLYNLLNFYKFLFYVVFERPTFSQVFFAIFLISFQWWCQLIVSLRLSSGGNLQHHHVNN